MKNLIYVLLVLFPGILQTSAQQVNGPVIRDLSGETWELRQEGSPSWMAAFVPGSVHTTLMKNERIPDPFERVNEKDLQWIDKVNWVYRTKFSVSPDFLSFDNLELVFEGIDTYADVFLNGKLVLQPDNMFRTWKAGVKDLLREDGNELLVVLRSPTLTGSEKLKQFGFQLAADNDQSEAGEMGGDRVSPYVRKAPYHFGWDWGPRLVTSGIWRPVKLVGWDEVRIEDVWVNTRSVSERGAKVEIITALNSNRGGPKAYSIYFGDSLISSGIWDLQPGITQQKSEFSFREVALWWPNGKGEPNLHTFRVEIFNKGRQFDRKEIVVGIRSAELVRDPDPEGTGESFYFRINGVPVFAKGANYIPNDVFLDRVSPEKYEYIIKSAAQANMNMLRVWGGGIYENEIFYELCDRYGIMVWQDFMFACAMYPGDDDFLDNVRIEAEENVSRLRNHACIVLWCGNNEIEAAWGPYDEKRGWGWKQRYNPEQREVIWKAYDTLFHRILPEVVAAMDPDRPYWHSSPSAGMGKLAGYEGNSGDVHYWGVWHGLHPLGDFRKYRARFMSEYGFQSFPEFSTVKKYALNEQDRDIESEVMMAHQRSGIGNLRIRQYMEADYQVPADFEQLLYVGQVLQAGAIRTAIEAHRGDMPFCMGTLYWQLNDVWPVASWSSIDYFGRWKALHYTVREAFKPTVLIVTGGPDSLEAIVASDIDENRPVKAEFQLKDFSGNVLWSKEQNQEMRSGAVTPLLSVSLPDLLTDYDPRTVFLESRLIDSGELLDIDLFYFVPPKDLQLEDPNIETNVRENGQSYLVTVRTANLAKNVYFSAEGFTGQFSDNYSDLIPGSVYELTFPKELSLEEFKRSLKVTHLQQTMNQAADEKFLKE